MHTSLCPKCFVGNSWLEVAGTDYIEILSIFIKGVAKGLALVATKINVSKSHFRFFSFFKWPSFLWNISLSSESFLRAQRKQDWV